MPEIKAHIVVAGKHFEPLVHHLRALLPASTVEASEVEHLENAVKEADVLIPAMTRINESVFRAADRLRLIQQWGSGLDGVDQEMARRYKVAVANVPTENTGNAESVAEWCVMAAICLSRSYPAVEATVREKGPWGAPAGRSLIGRTAGFVGFGGIGRALASRLRPFGMHLAAVKRSPDHDLKERFHLVWLGDMDSLPQLIAMSDYLFICLPLKPETFELIGEKEFDLMPDGAFLINASRGPIIGKEALQAALNRGRIGGAALDVYWSEPPDPEDALFQCSNLLVTPHIGGVTDVSYHGIGSGVAENIRRVMSGEAPLNWANPHGGISWLK